MFRYYKEMFIRWKDFKGWSGRANFWHAMLLNIIIGGSFYLLAIFLLIGGLSAALASSSPSGLGAGMGLSFILSIIGNIYILIAFLPALSLSIRRLRDVGLAEEMLYVYVIGGVVLSFVLLRVPYVGRIAFLGLQGYLIYLYSRPSDYYRNQSTGLDSVGKMADDLTRKVKAGFQGNASQASSHQEGGGLTIADEPKASASQLTSETAYRQHHQKLAEKYANLAAAKEREQPPQSTDSLSDEASDYQHRQKLAETPANLVSEKEGEQQAQPSASLSDETSYYQKRQELKEEKAPAAPTPVSELNDAQADQASPAVASQTSPARDKRAITILLGLLAATLGLLLIVYAVNQSTQESSSAVETSTASSIYVDMEDYEISLISYGENGSGTLEASVDSIPAADEGLTAEQEDFLQHPTFQFSQDSGLSNGDKVEVTISLDEEKAAELGLELSSSSHTLDTLYRVSQLDEPASSSVTKSSSQSASSSTSQASNLEADLHTLLDDFASAINSSIRNQQDDIAPYFESSNSIYKELRDYYINGAQADHIDHYESRDRVIRNIRQSGDTIDFTVDFTSIVYYTDGRDATSSRRTRDYRVMKVNGRYVIDYLSNL